MLPFPYTNALQSKQLALAHIGSRSTIMRLYLSLYLSTFLTYNYVDVINI